MDIKVITTQEAINEEAVFHSVDEEELKVKAKEGFFVRNRNLNCVYCPMGNILNFKRKKTNNDLFIGNSQCLNRLNKCTKNVIKELEMNSNRDLAASKKFHTTLKNKTIIFIIFYYFNSFGNYLF